MSEAKRRKKSKGAREDVVIRISKENYERLNSFKEPVEGSNGKKRTESLNECLERVLEGLEALKSGQTLYLYGGVVYGDLAEARGEAVMDAARYKQPVEWPSIAVVVGEDQP
jgi:predicted DNA-binding protein